MNEDENKVEDVEVENADAPTDAIDDESADTPEVAA